MDNLGARRSTWNDQETRAWEMDHDLADPLVVAAYGDVLRRERHNLSVNLDPAIVIGHDAHLLADLSSVWIVGIVLGDSFWARFCRDAKGFLGGHFFAEAVSDARTRFSHAATWLRAAKILSTPASARSSSAARFDRRYQTFM